MAQVINTNIMSLNAQRQLNKTQAASNEAMERLSSGLRINSAKDDAAGLAISTAMQSQITGLTQAVRNSNDGISMAQTAEGAMDEMTNILQRMRELSVQSANDTNSASNRAAIQEEVDQLYSELDRIADTTQFNGTNLLDGSNASTTLQIGANAGETLTFSIDSVTTAALGLDGGVNKGDLNGGRVLTAAIDDDDIEINGVGISGVAADAGAVEMAKAINLETASTGVVADAYNVVEGKALDNNTVTGITNELELTVGDAETITLGPTSSMQNLAETINRDVEGLQASVGDDGQLILNNDTGQAITVGGAVDGSGIEANTYQGYLGLTSQSGEPISVDNSDTAITGDTKSIGFMVTNGPAVNGETIIPTSNITDVDNITINGVDLEVSPIDGKVATLQEKVDAINNLTSSTNVTAALNGDSIEFTMVSTLPSAPFSDISIISGSSDPDASLAKLGVTPSDSGTGITSIAGNDIDLLSNNINTTDEITINGVPLEVNFDSSGTRAEITQEKINAINQLTEQTGVTARLNSEEDGMLFTNASGGDILIASSSDDSTTALAKLGVIDVGGTSVTELKLNVTTATSASDSISKIDDALATISSSRANLGAIQNRLDSTISNLENVSQNLSASNSRIQDADFAAETSNMSKAQILQQAGTSMLSQANASSQNVLSLLQQKFNINELLGFY